MTRQIVVRAVDEQGAPVWEEPLPHGADPAQVLTNAGWRPQWLSASAEGLRTVLTYAVRPAEVPVAHQRLGAYAVVQADYDGAPCLLLTSFTGDGTGRWGLPGGGVDEGEDPQDAVVREVWEETGQQVDVVEAVQVHTGHWTGHSLHGRWEDFHAVRLLYRAHCPVPQQPVVHDLGGTTADAQWVPVPQVEHRRLAAWTSTVVQDLVRGG